MTVTLKNLTINLEEELLYKLVRFAAPLLSADEGDDESAVAFSSHDHSNMEQLRQLSGGGGQQQLLPRYYVGTLKLTLNQIKLSVAKSNKIRMDLEV